MTHDPIDRKRREVSRGAAATLLLLGTGGIGSAIMPARAQTTTKDQSPQRPPASSHDDKTYSESEVIAAAEGFFGTTAQGLAEAVHKVFAERGEPNAYIQGEEAGGAFVVGLRYGAGDLVFKDGRQAKVFWQGPSAGWDFGADAVKSFTLVYGLPSTDAIYQRFPGVAGSAFFIGGIAVNYQQRGDVVLAPMRAGVGLRLGVNVGYLKYSREREWLPL